MFMVTGGRVDMFNVSQEHTISGIFIKHVLDDSPAKANASLKTGDRILEVSVYILSTIYYSAKDVQCFSDFYRLPWKGKSKIGQLGNGG